MPISRGSKSPRWSRPKPSPASRKESPSMRNVAVSASVSVILHGGEPLLAGPERLDEIITILNDQINPAAALRVKIHTNAVLLSERYLKVFEKHAVQIGISLDGDREAERPASPLRQWAQQLRPRRQEHRTAAAEQPRSVQRHPLHHRHEKNDPIRVYESLLRLNPRRSTSCFPHATWEEPPPRRAETDYADWLSAIYDRWEQDERPVRIRLFDSIIRTTYGESSLSEAIGVEPSSLVVIDTDGSYEQVDSLKVAFDGAPATGLDVFRNTLDEVAGHPGINARQNGIEGLSPPCQACPVVSSCGGGLYPPFRDNSFDNPSVYCADLFKLISHVREATLMRAHQVPEDHRVVRHRIRRCGRVRSLTESQASIRRMLLSDIGSADPETLKDPGQPRRARPGVTDTVFAHPYVRVWAVDCPCGARRSSVICATSPPPSPSGGRTSPDPRRGEGRGHPPAHRRHPGHRPYRRIDRDRRGPGPAPRRRPRMAARPHSPRAGIPSSWRTPTPTATVISGRSPGG